MAEKDYRPLIAALRAQGWDLCLSEHGHYRATPPPEACARRGGRASIVHFATHTGDPRAMKNTLRDLRASGFVYPPVSWAHVGATFGDGMSVPLAAPEHAGATNGKHLDGQSTFVEPVDPLEQPIVPPAATDIGLDLDSLFNQLKTARDEHAIAAMDVEDRSAQLAKCEEQLNDAVACLKTATASLREAKRRFDAAFAAEETTT